MIHPIKATRNFAKDANRQYKYIKETNTNVFKCAAYCAAIPLTVPLERAIMKNQGF